MHAQYLAATNNKILKLLAIARRVLQSEMELRLCTRCILCKILNSSYHAERQLQSEWIQQSFSFVRCLLVNKVDIVCCGYWAGTLEGWNGGYSMSRTI